MAQKKHPDKASAMRATHIMAMPVIAAGDNDGPDGDNDADDQSTTTAAPTGGAASS